VNGARFFAVTPIAAAACHLRRPASACAQRAFTSFVSLSPARHAVRLYATICCVAMAHGCSLSPFLRRFAHRQMPLILHLPPFAA